MNLPTFATLSPSIVMSTNVPPKKENAKPMIQVMKEFELFVSLLLLPIGRLVIMERSMVILIVYKIVFAIASHQESVKAYSLLRMLEIVIRIAVTTRESVVVPRTKATFLLVILWLEMIILFFFSESLKLITTGRAPEKMIVRIPNGRN